jgi:lactoylglutathione lyase
MMKTLLTAYHVADLAGSVDFYARVGFREIGRATFEDGTTRVMLNLPGDGDFVTLELVHEPSAGPIKVGNGFSHVVLQVDDLAAKLDDLARAGIAGEDVALPGDAGGMGLANLRDPGGYRIELVQWPPGHPDGLTSADFQGRPFPGSSAGVSRCLSPGETVGTRRGNAADRRAA